MKMSTIVIFFIVQWYMSLFCQTFFLHRYAAHNMFTMSRGAEKFFYILTFITQGSSYLSPWKYGILHRLHHAYADTKDDPHSPSFTKGIFALMLKTRDIYQGIGNGKIPVEDKYKKNLPSWDRFEFWAEDIFTRLIFVSIYAFLFLHFAEHVWEWVLLPFCILMGPVHGAIINYFAHKFGYRNYDTADTSRNFLPVDVLMMGESYHNNHHKYMHKPNFGIRWHEIDPTYPIIYLLHKMRVIKLRK